ncbi:MAG: type III pantothenate kinase [Clostridia bacterium]|nr:type III pantothenate kinase [Clostridia bacterium]
MLLALDVGNTNIKVGIYREGLLCHSWRLATDVHRTSDEYGVQMEAFFGHLGLSMSSIDGIIMSSVVPSINYTIEHMCRLYFSGLKPMIVGAGLTTGLINRYDNPEALGSDRLCNAAFAYYKYGGPCVAIDFGTATNFSVVSEKGEFLGGVICPGMRVSTDALIENAAMLPKIDFIKPDRIICSNPEDAIRAGIINGYVGQVEHIIGLIFEELGMKATVIATGGMSTLIAQQSSAINILDPLLTLDGLAYIYRLNA